MPRTPLGKPLPPVQEDEQPPSQRELQELSATWDALMPEYAGLNQAQSKAILDATGAKPTALWIWDEVTRTYIRVANGQQVTLRQMQSLLEQFTQRLARQ